MEKYETIDLKMLVNYIYNNSVSWKWVGPKEFFWIDLFIFYSLLEEILCKVMGNVVLL